MIVQLATAAALTVIAITSVHGMKEGLRELREILASLHDTSYGAGYDNGYEDAESAEREWRDA